jgi:prepilin-type N-terminal cleavage/methylation domain-containing protein
VDARPSGFTLIELLVVIVVIGILAAIAIPKYSRARERAYIAAVTSDLKNLATLQEIYHSDHEVYAAALTDLPDYHGSDGVTITINAATGTGWAATGVHAGLTQQCGFFYGSASPSDATPATIAGSVACQS